MASAPNHVCLPSDESRWRSEPCTRHSCLHRLGNPRDRRSRTALVDQVDNRRRRTIHADINPNRQCGASCWRGSGHGRSRVAWCRRKSAGFDAPACRWNTKPVHCDGCSLSWTHATIVNTSVYRGFFSLTSRLRGRRLTLTIAIWVSVARQRCVNRHSPPAALSHKPMLMTPSSALCCRAIQLCHQCDWHCELHNRSRTRVDPL